MKNLNVVMISNEIMFHHNDNDNVQNVLQRLLFVCILAINAPMFIIMLQNEVTFFALLSMFAFNLWYLAKFSSHTTAPYIEIVEAGKVNEFSNVVLVLIN